MPLSWDWRVVVDKGSNAKAETKDKSGKSHRGLFCRPEHGEKAKRRREAVYKPQRDEEL